MRKILILIFLIICNLSTVRSQETEGVNAMATETGYIDVEGGRIYYESAGKGKHIVLIHDGLIHHEIWDEQFPIFAEFSHVVRYDRRGYGRSPDPDAPFSNIADLNQLFLQLKMDKAVVFGMSAGGGLAIDFTLKYPEKVTGLVLVGAVVSGYGYSSHMFSRGGRVESLQELLADPQKIIEYFGREDPYQMYTKNEKAKERCHQLLKANPQNADFRKSTFVQPAERPAVKHLSEIKVPALILVGEYDIPDVHAHAGVIETGIPDANREVILKAGHLIPMEQPEAFNKVVLEFLKKQTF